MADDDHAEYMTQLAAQSGVKPLDSGKQPPVQTPTNPEKQQELETRVKNNDELAQKNIREPQGEQAAQLNKMVDDIYAAMPGAFPEAKNLPARPKLLIYDDNEIGIKNFPSTGANANVLAISSEALKQMTPEELKGMLAHEIAGHELAQVNPEMQKKFIPANMHDAAKDMKAQGITSEPKDALRREIYMSEMLADQNEIRLTHNTAAFKSASEKIAAQGKIVFAESANAIVDAQMESIEKKTGRKLPDDYREKEMQHLREQLDKENSANPHPSDAVRNAAVDKVEQKLEHPPENPVMHIIHGLEHIVHPQHDAPAQQR